MGPAASQPQANPGPRGGPPLPSPASAGSPGGEGSHGGSLGSGWSPSFPSGPHGAGSGAREASPGLPAPSPRRAWDLGRGQREREKREGGGEGEGKKIPFSLHLWTSGVLVSFVFLM